MKRINYDISLTGFLVGLVMIAMFVTFFSVVISGLATEYGLTGDNSFDSYANFTALQEDTEEIRDATEISPDSGLLDIIGGYFSSGYSALKITFGSFDLFGDMLSQADEDFSFMGQFQFSSFLWVIVILMILIGVIVSALLKMRI